MPLQTMDEKAIFNLARCIDVSEARAEYLKQVCGPDPKLFSRVVALLEIHEQERTFLELPAIAENPAAGTPSPERPGTQIGPYKLLEQIGTGGMGDVYVAEQKEPVRRKVALKVIKPGMDTRQVVARFEAERQALAMMNHPNIAKVLDAGATDAGRPYFVMELVKGAPITEFCDQQKLDTRERLQLFISVCQAVQHAHHKGLIHRDIKPSNVLVEVHDVTPVPKVIDFGVAKAIGQSLTEKTLHTGFGEIVGTPMYMSPEQAGQSSIDVDTRSDIYSLGVLLYEILTGHTPFERDTLRNAGFDEMRRMIREVDPPRPSARVSTLEAKALSTLSDCRKVGPGKLSQQLRGELDWIVMKALEKDRNRRYESANSLAADVQRYLSDEPVQACPPSAGYRFRKFARKNRVPLTTAAVMAATLLIGSAVSVWQAMEATRARTLADERFDTERQARREAVEQRKLADQRLENEKLARAEAVKHRQQASDNLRQAVDVVDQMLVRVGDNRMMAIPGVEPLRRELFQDALRFYDKLLPQAPDDPQLRRSTLIAWLKVARIHSLLGNDAKVQETRQQAIPVFEAFVADYPDDAEVQVHLADLYRLNSATNADARVPELEKAMAVRHDLQRRFPENLDYQWDATQTEMTLADTYGGTGRYEEAERTYRHVIDVQRQLWSRQAVSGKKHWFLCNSLVNLYGFLRASKQQDENELEALCREAFNRAEQVVASDPQSAYAVIYVVQTAHLYGDYLKDRGRGAEAETQFRRAVEVGQFLLRANAHNLHEIAPLPDAQCALADFLARDGRHLEALELYRTAHETMGLATAFHAKFGYWEDIIRRAERGLLNSLGQMVMEGHHDEVRKFCEELSQTADTESMTPQFHNNFAWFLATCSVPELRDVGQALKRAQKATALEPKIGVYWNTLGVCLYRAGDWKAAVTALEKSMELRTGGDSFDWFFLAMAHWQQGDKEQARKWYDKAVDWMDKNQPQNDELLRFRAEAEELLKDKPGDTDPD